MLEPLETQEYNGDGDCLDAVQRVWVNCAPATSQHPYLARYKLPVERLRVWKTCLIAPLVDGDDRPIGLLIVDAEGASRSWLPMGGTGHYCIGNPGHTVFVALTDLADALALHDISGHQTILTTSDSDAGALRDKLLAADPGRRVLMAG